MWSSLHEKRSSKQKMGQASGDGLRRRSGFALEGTCESPRVWLMQVKDLNAGAFGFVVLAKDKKTNDKVAIKFLAKGPKITKVGSEFDDGFRSLSR